MNLAWSVWLLVLNSNFVTIYLELVLFLVLSAIKFIIDA